MEKISEKLLKHVSVSLECISKPYAAYYKKYYDLTPNQMSAIWYLLHSGTMTMSQFASTLYMSKQQATQHIEQLVQKGLVERGYQENNRRVINIFVTEKGKNIVEDIKQKYTDTFLEELNKFTETERDELLGAIEVLNKYGPLLELRPK